ncbi:MAG: DNA replication complex GINS family protein [Methanomassiliicoccales archaeon]|nr:MAG: DNA replication complex GINS family protein [Methanomassiliicoccales archaeon]
MAEEGITFERITRIYREETGKNTLTKLEMDFYVKLNGYIEDLRSRTDEELAIDPHSSKAILLQNELRKISQKRDQIYRTRERKIALMASARVGGTDVDTKVLTKNEKVLFEKLVDDLKDAREEVFSGDRTVTEKKEKKAPEVETQKKPPPKEEAKKQEAEEDLAVVQALEDIPPFAGIDVTYELKKEEVVTLPKKVAKILTESGKAKLLEINNP